MKPSFKSQVDRLIAHIRKVGPRTLGQLTYELDLSPNYLLRMVHAATENMATFRFEDFGDYPHPKMYLLDIEDKKTADWIEVWLKDRHARYETSRYHLDPWAVAVVLAKERRTGKKVEHWDRPKEVKADEST